MINELREAIQKDRLFDYIANNYHRMTKEELKRLCLELEYVRDTELKGIGSSNDRLIEALEESFEFEEV